MKKIKRLREFLGGENFYLIIAILTIVDFIINFFYTETSNRAIFSAVCFLTLVCCVGFLRESKEDKVSDKKEE